MTRLNQSMIQKAIKKDVMLSLNEDVMGNDLTSSIIDKKKISEWSLKIQSVRDFMWAGMV